MVILRVILGGQTFCLSSSLPVAPVFDRRTEMMDRQECLSPDRERSNASPWCQSFVRCICRNGSLYWPHDERQHRCNPADRPDPGDDPPAGLEEHHQPGARSAPRWPMGESTLSGVLDSEDTRVMIEALQRLGIAVEHDPAAAIVRIAGCGGELPASRGQSLCGQQRHHGRGFSRPC